MPCLVNAYVGISYLKPVLHIFSETIQGENDTQLTNGMKTTTKTYLNGMYLDSCTDHLVDMAALLDPCLQYNVKSGKVEHIKTSTVEEIKSLQTEQQACATGTSSALPWSLAVAVEAKPEVK